jgi:predicted hotdog family 3-hydroxylacyl-ACP dehydratase
MRLDRAWIEGHIPHRGRMCLLDEVIVWDAEHISCRSATHRAADHPLRAHGRLGIACGIEYAAQAMAVHGALAAGALVGLGRSDSAPIRDVASASTPVAGFLASVRGVRFHVLRLDDVQSELICDAVRIAGDRGTALYEFELRSETACLLNGRASVVFDAGKQLHL